MASMARAAVASAEVAAAKAMVTVARAARATRVAEKGVEEKVPATTSVVRAGVGTAAAKVVAVGEWPRSAEVMAAARAAAVMEAVGTVAGTAGAAMVSEMAEVAKEVEERAPGTTEKSYPGR